MPSVRSLVLPLSVAACLGVGCSSAVGTSDSTGVGQTAEAVTSCPSQLSCCVGSPTPLNTSDPFQAQLAAWGCSQTKPYTPKPASNAWWFWSVCPDPNKTIETFLANNPKYDAAPYDAIVTTSLATACAPPPPSGHVHVLWDPTCPTCSHM